MIMMTNLFIYLLIVNKFLFITQNYCTTVINFKLVSLNLSSKRGEQCGKGADIRIKVTTIDFCMYFQSLWPVL